MAVVLIMSTIFVFGCVGFLLYNVATWNER
jgi:hypothetical protein